jgi:quercetin dioxygenase-like cupin family protein
MAPFPDLFQTLPEAEVPVPGVKVRLLRGPTASAIFWEATQDTAVPQHRHGGQWGVVLEGEIRLTVGSDVRTCRRGDEYYIPAGTPHSAVLKKGARVLDFFDDPDRYRPKQ